MPTPFDLLSEKLDDEADPDDQLRLELGQNQGANLAGAPQPPGAPMPNIPGPLAALAPPPGKPSIKLKAPAAVKPKVKLKAKKKAKPHIKLKSALQGYLDAIGRTD